MVDYNSSAILKPKRIQKLTGSSSYLSYHPMITSESFVKRLKILENPKKPLFLPPFFDPPKNPQKHPKIRADFSSTFRGYTIRTKFGGGRIPEHANLYRY